MTKHAPPRRPPPLPPFKKRHTSLSAESTPRNAFDKPFTLQMFSQIHHAMKSKQQKENKREKEILVGSVFATFMLSP